MHAIAQHLLNSQMLAVSCSCKGQCSTLRCTCPKYQVNVLIIVTLHIQATMVNVKPSRKTRHKIFVRCASVCLLQLAYEVWSCRMRLRMLSLFELRIQSECGFTRDSSILQLGSIDVWTGVDLVGFGSPRYGTRLSDRPPFNTHSVGHLRTNYNSRNLAEF